MNDFVYGQFLEWAKILSTMDNEKHDRALEKQFIIEEKSKHREEFSAAKAADPTGILRAF